MQSAVGGNVISVPEGRHVYRMPPQRGSKPQPCPAARTACPPPDKREGRSVISPRRALGDSRACRAINILSLRDRRRPLPPVPGLAKNRDARTDAVAQVRFPPLGQLAIPCREIRLRHRSSPLLRLSPPWRDTPRSASPSRRATRGMHRPARTMISWSPG